MEENIQRKNDTEDEEMDVEEEPKMAEILTQNKSKKICKICGKFGNSKYYNVQSCGGCKQFFRRIIVKRIEFFCTLDGNCDLTKNKCRGCRLDQCLRMGMEPNFVQAERNEYFQRFVKRIEKRRDELMSKMKTEYQIIMDGNENENKDYCNEMEQNMEIKIINQKQFLSNSDWEIFQYFCRLLYVQNGLWNGLNNLPTRYLDRFQWIEEVFDGPDNILSLGTYLDPNLSIPEAMKTLNWQESIGKEKSSPNHNPRIRKGQGAFVLMVVGILKAMPPFSKLPFADKLIITRQTNQQIGWFLNTFYSAKKGAQAIVGPGGVSMIAMINAKYNSDEKIIKLAKKHFISPLEEFYRIPMLMDEEFILLLAILCSNPAITGLSEYARQVLERGQSGYSRILMQYCQMNLGGQQGARRYAECIRLINIAFSASRNFDLLNTYIEVSHSGLAFYSGIFPECLKSIFT